jgi:hypothetical protein
MIMTQDVKDLLLQDLCGRLPYGVKVGTTDNDDSLENVWDTLWYNTFTEDVKLTHSIEDADKIVDISEIKPYLFPLSSMTYEQKEEMVNKGIAYYQVFDGIGRRFFFKEGYELYDWLNNNHFDYRGLIEKSLAIDATNLEIYK